MGAAKLLRCPSDRAVLRAGRGSGYCGGAHLETRENVHGDHVKLWRGIGRVREYEVCADALEDLLKATPQETILSDDWLAYAQASLPAHVYGRAYNRCLLGA